MGPAIDDDRLRGLPIRRGEPAWWLMAVVIVAVAGVVTLALNS